MNELLFSIASGYVKADPVPKKDVTAFSDATGFYTLAVASLLCEKEKEKCKELFTEKAKKTLSRYLPLLEGNGVSTDGETVLSPVSISLFYEGALLLGEPLLLGTALSAALSEFFDTDAPRRILSGEELSFGGAALFPLAAYIRTKTLQKEAISLTELGEFCRACVRAGDVADLSGEPVFSLSVRAYRYKAFLAESLFARLVGISLALPEPPQCLESPEREYLSAEANAFYAYAVASAALLGRLFPEPLLSESDVSFREGERVGVDGHPFLSSDTVLLRGGERLCGASSKGGGEIFFRPYSMPRLLTDSFLCRIRGIYPLSPEVAEFAVDAEMKGGFSLRLRRLHRTSLYGDGDRENCLTVAEEHVAFAALPEDETVLVISVTKAKNNSYLSENTGLSLFVPVRDEGVYYYADARHPRRMLRRREGDGEVGEYLNIDDAFGIVANRPMMLSRGGLDRPDAFSFASAEGGRYVEAGEILSSVSLAGALGGIRKTRALQESFLTLSALPSGVYSASVIGANRKRYTLLYNLSGKDFLWEGRTVEDGKTALLVWSR